MGGRCAEITTGMDDMRGQTRLRNADAIDDLDINRLAVLRAGFKYLGREDPLAQEPYIALAVFPDGYSFLDSDAAVLLGDEKAAAGLWILERWAVVRAGASEKYRMHHAHVDFARSKLMVREDVRKPSVDRWTSRISRWEFAVGVDPYPLLNLWHALERVWGEGWFGSCPCDDQLAQIDGSNPSEAIAIHVFALLYGHDSKFREIDAIKEARSAVRRPHGGLLSGGADGGSLLYLVQSRLAGACQGGRGSWTPAR